MNKPVFQKVKILEKVEIEIIQVLALKAIKWNDELLFVHQSTKAPGCFSVTHRQTGLCVSTETSIDEAINVAIKGFEEKYELEKHRWQCEYPDEQWKTIDQVDLPFPYQIELPEKDQYRSDEEE